MKKVLAAALVVAAGFLVGSMAFAARGPGYGPGPGAQVDVQALRSFQKETLPLRDEMMAKRLELRNEFSKEKPDQNRIATLQKEMIDLRTKIQESAQKNGLPNWAQGRMMGRGGYGPGCGGPGYGGGYGPGKQAGRGGYGPGCGNGCGGGYGPRW
jgi:zinc resistance-associated protein